MSDTVNASSEPELKRLINRIENSLRENSEIINTIQNKVTSIGRRMEPSPTIMGAGVSLSENQKTPDNFVEALRATLASVEGQTLMLSEIKSHFNQLI